MNMAKRTVGMIRNGAYDSRLKKQPPANNRLPGLTREQVQDAHDIPARIIKALDAVIESFEDEMAYEEAEVKRLCKVCQADIEYWNEITETHRYAEYYGYTEKGVRIWGTKSEVAWMLDNITGFRKEL